MNTFSISQLAQFSGIKPHTIRIWEQRYNALKPSRSEGNTRYYDNLQLRRLLNIVSLIDADNKISELCALSDEVLFGLLDKLNNDRTASSQSEYFISQLVLAGMSYDKPHFEKIFSHCLLRYGMKRCYTEVIYPLLERLGLMWVSNTLLTAHEHFISNCIRQKLFTAIDSLSSAKPESDTWLLFLPENEFHDTGLLLADYLIKLAGKKVIYLGSNVPLQSITEAIEDIKPDYLLMFLVHRDTADNTDKYLNELSSVFCGEKIYVSGNKKMIDQLKVKETIQWLQSVDDLQQQLAS